MFHSHSGIIILASDYEPVSPVCFHFDQISAASLIQRRNCWNQGSSGGSTTSILLQRFKDNCWHKRLPPPTSAHMITFLIAEAVGTSSGVCVWWWCLGVSPWRYRSFHFYFLLLPWGFRPHSWVFGFRTAGPSYDARPDSAGLPAQPPAPCCPPETPAAPPEPPGSCRHTENKSNQNAGFKKPAGKSSLTLAQAYLSTFDSTTDLLLQVLGSCDGKYVHLTSFTSLKRVFCTRGNIFNPNSGCRDGNLSYRLWLKGFSVTWDLRKNVLSQAGMSAHTLIPLSINGKWRNQPIMRLRVMVLAQSQGIHLQWSAFQPAGDALNLDLNHVAAADRSSLTVVSLKLKQVCASLASE